MTMGVAAHGPKCRFPFLKTKIRAIVSWRAIALPRVAATGGFTFRAFEAKNLEEVEFSIW
jgi:hypothetical protein